MNIFNSLGSNYDLKFALKALFAQNNSSYREKLIKFLEKRYGGRAVLVYKGREAIELALEILKFSWKMSSRGANIPQVAINGFTCFAVYKAIETVGYEAVCLDLDNNFDLNFSAQELLKAIKHNSKIKAVIIQNTLGYPCDIEKIVKICKENNLILIEDLAHSVGTIYKNGKEAGTVGDFVVLSFSQDKIIDAISGGALIIRNKKYQDYYSSSEERSDESRSGNETMKQLNNISLKQQLLDRLYPLFTYKIRTTYRMGLGKLLHFIFKKINLLSKPMNESFYTKYDLPNWYCSLVLVSFHNLKKNLEHRKRIVHIYNSMLNKKITYPSILRYCIFVKNRKSLVKFLKNREVYISDVWYDDVDKSLPNAQIVANSILNLPTHKNVSENDARKIAQEINLWNAGQSPSSPASEAKYRTAHGEADRRG